MFLSKITLNLIMPLQLFTNEKNCTPPHVYVCLFFFFKLTLFLVTITKSVTEVDQASLNLPRIFLKGIHIGAQWSSKVTPPEIVNLILHIWVLYPVLHDPFTLVFPGNFHFISFTPLELHVFFEFQNEIKLDPNKGLLWLVRESNTEESVLSRSFVDLAIPLNPGVKSKFIRAHALQD